MNIFTIVRKEIISVVNQMIKNGDLPDDLSLEAITAEPPRDSSHGDIATNAAMAIAKKAGKKPRDLAEDIKAGIEKIEYVSKVDIAGPGFINIRLSNNKWYEVIKYVLDYSDDYGKSDIGNNEKINIEYVSANPTGPMHIGHARGAVVGDVLANLLAKAGYDVTKEYYINDAGGQVDTLARSVYLRYLEVLGEDIGDIPEGLYPGDYLIPVGKLLADKYGDKYQGKDESEWLEEFRPIALEAMMNLIKADLKELGISHDIYSSEKYLLDNNQIEKSIDMFVEKGLVYEGILEPPKGKLPDDWEEREQTLFKATDYGDDVDRPLKKSDGSYTYFASDIAYHQDKLERGFNNMVLVLGADHGGYVKRMKAAISAMSDGKAKMNILLYQLVNFLENGQAMKMSKRAGTYITVHDVVEAVGSDVVRFIMLTRKTEAILNFDLQKATEQSKDNPVFYVQYAHTRIHSVIRNLANEFPDMSEGNLSSANLELLIDKNEIDLIRIMAQWPRIIEASAKTLEPHRIAFYLQELAASFHSLWNMGNSDPSLRFIIAGNKELTEARIALITACANVIASGLEVMGVKPVTKM